VELVQLWVQALTGMRLEGIGSYSVLDADAIATIRRGLDVGTEELVSPEQ
jgi:hypothetical protein